MCHLLRDHRQFQLLWQFHPLHSSSLLNINITQIKKHLTHSTPSSKQSNRSFIYLKRAITPDIAAELKKLTIPGLGLMREYKRYYPGSKETAQLIGYTNISGDRLNLEFVISPLVGAEGTSDSYVLSFQDLTVVRRLEFAMRQSEKLAAVGQLAAGIAHEIRNPLASISGSIELLGQGGQTSPEDQKKLMSIVLKEIDRLNNMITEFLDYVKPNQVSDESVQLPGLLTDICEMNKLNKNLRKETEVVLELTSKKIIAGSRDKLRQALINIIINAHQAVSEQQQPRVKVVCIDGDKKVIVKISDNGIGIEEARLKKIFEPFHTTKAKGTGLGLAVTHKILEAHNAQIFVESQKGIGTQFTLEFPERGERSELPLAQTKIPEDNLTWGIQKRKAK